jgi:LuxR family transcriptional regulator, maltose regulon positive regulatory protein
MSSSDVRGAVSLRGHAEADDPVLTSKVTVPEVPGWAVARPRIDKLLTEGARGSLTSVTGPPGAGKTMAIASWAVGDTGTETGNTETGKTPGCTLAWVTLDDYDNKPRVFWSYVVAALRRAGLSVPRVMPGPTREAVEHAFLVRLASVLATQDPPVVLVLDDLHLLTDPATLDGLDYVQRNAHPGLRLVVASRVDPLLPLHRYRLTGELAEIRADDLAFSVEESGLILAHHGISLSEAAIEGLTQRTEGWVAGIRLAALSLHGHPDPEQFVKELEAEDSAVTGYLVDEVLNAQSPPVRDMLISTSILDCVNADLAIELTGDPQAAHVLPDLVRANAFVRPIGHGWYRYHSLLVAVLRLKLRIEHGGQVPHLYQIASRWYQRHGLLNEAARYAAESGDWPLAAEIVVDEFAVGQLLDPRGDQPLAETYARMPRDGGWTRPQPWLVAAATELSGPVREMSSTAALATAESILDRLPSDEEIPARLAACLIRMALSRQTGDLEAATAAAVRADIVAGQLPMEAHVRHPELRVQLLAGRGTIELWAGRLNAAAADFAEGIAACVPGTGYERAYCLGYLALVEALQGRLSQAAGHADEVIEVMRSVSESVTEHITSAVSVALASVHLQRGDMQEAHAQLKRAEVALRIFPDKLVSALACLVAAQRRLAESRAAAVLEMIRRARQDWSPPGWLELRLTILESRAHVLAGDVQAAVAAARCADPRSVPEAAVALAHAWLASGDCQAARCALDAVSEGRGEGNERFGLPGWLVDARLSYAIGDNRRGRRSLERALMLAKPERMKLPFVMEQAWMRQVLRRDPELAQASREVLEPAAAAPSAVPAQRRSASQEAPLVVERLSERESEVLTLLSGMLSTAEIASEMYLSVNTVKTHLRSIYRKLSAAHRGEAVRRARQLELI